VREVLRVIDQPGMISFAGGLPAAESFPELDLQGVDQHLQYGATEGEEALRDLIASDLCERGLSVSADQILILSGSQQGIDLVAKLLVQEGTPVAVESPTYLAALQVFSLYGAAYRSIDVVNGGLAGSVSGSALTYVVPTFQNPTGHCYTAAERRTVAAACDAADTVLFEDDPYRDLCYAPCDRTPVCAGLERSSWVYQSSFSKTFAPGLRLGYLACSKDLFSRLAWLKQAADLHTNRLSQQLVLQQLHSADNKDRLTRLTDLYREKRDHFEAVLNQHFKGLAGWDQPLGGLFFWLRLKSVIDTNVLLEKTLQKRVAVMPGTPFFATDTDAYPALRLNFSHASEAQVEHGLAVLADLIRHS